MPVDPAESFPDAGFDVVRRGYDLGQVDTHLRRLDAEIAILAADRNAAVDQATQLARELDDARARAEKLRGQVRTLAGPPQSVQGMSERMRSMLRLAEDEVADMLGRAETDAAQRRQEAEQHSAHMLATAQEEADQVLRDAREKAAAHLGPAQMEATELAERTVRERAQIKTDRALMERKLAEDRATMERELAERREALDKQIADELAESRRRLADERKTVEERLAEQRATVEQALAAQRATVERELAEAVHRGEAERVLIEEDFRIAMDQRRTEALAALKAERATAEREIAELRQGSAARLRHEKARVETECRRLLADAERRAGELTALRGRIVEQLAETRAALGRSLGSLEPLPAEAGARTTGRAPAADSNGHDETPADDSPTVRTEAATLTDLEPHGTDSRPTPQRRPRAAAGRR